MPKERLPQDEESSVVIQAKNWSDEPDEGRHATLLEASTQIEEFCNVELDNMNLTVCDSEWEYTPLVLVILTPAAKLGPERRPEIDSLPWSEYHTGGGCMALYHVTPAGYALITDEGGCAIPEPGEVAMLGFYDEEGQQRGECVSFHNTEGAKAFFHSLGGNPGGCTEINTEGLIDA
jgi:hypothetical protein